MIIPTLVVFLSLMGLCGGFVTFLDIACSIVLWFCKEETRNKWKLPFRKHLTGPIMFAVGYLGLNLLKTIQSM